MKQRTLALAVAIGLGAVLAGVTLLWRPQPHAGFPPGPPISQGIWIQSEHYPDTGFGAISPLQRRSASVVAVPTSTELKSPSSVPNAHDWRSPTRAETLARQIQQQQPHSFPMPRGYLSDYLDPDESRSLRLAQDAIAADEDLLLPGQAPSANPPLAKSEPPTNPTTVAPPQTEPPLTPSQPLPLPPKELPRAIDGTKTLPNPSVVTPSPSDQVPPEELPIPPAKSGTSPSGVEPIPAVDNLVSPHASAPPPTMGTLTPGEDPHAAVFAKNCYPSAKECRVCHEQIYDEWAASSHAYASVSPMFHKFEQTINSLAQGTLGYFCVRCHAPVATSMGIERHVPIYASVASATEGVTCVACHRVKQSYGKVNGERRIEPGPVWDPMYGTGTGEGLKEVLAKKEEYKVKDQPGQQGPGQDIHAEVIQFEQLSWSHFCASCHQVAVHPGIALEVVWAQYRASPAHAQGISCQECHMGQDPGLPNGYTTAPVAIVNQKPISPERKHSNHLFYGPGYSIAHPGVFPHHPKADRWKMPEWIQFDYRAGWGTEAFEDALEQGRVVAQFPEVWKEVEDREDAREIIDENLQKLSTKRDMRKELMENTSRLDGPSFPRPPKRGHALKFHYDVRNLNSGHNLPTGSLGAQPQLWLNVALTGPRGQRLWESGYVDANGDMADLHSLEVAKGRIPRDQQLFNLQTKFLITHVKGTDREFYLPINLDVDQLPFIRPSGFPITVMNHPPQIRMEAHSVPPLGVRTASYHVPGHLLQEPGVYRLSARMRSRAEPIYFMRFCKSTPEMERTMNEWMLDFHEQSFDFIVP